MMAQLRWLMAGVLFGIGAVVAQPQDAGPKGSGDLGMAERLAELGQNTLRAKEVMEPAWQQSAALLEAAMRLAPAEARFARLRAEAELGAKNPDAAAEALRILLKIDPTDQGAQVQLIEIFSHRMETAEARMKYLQGVTEEKTVAAEVRSHAAVALARVYQDRSQPKEAMAAVESALKLNQYNAEALRLKYDFVGEDLKGPQQAELFAAMLRSNPAQGDVCARLAKELADLALAADAATWFDRAISIRLISGMQIDPALMVDYSACLSMRGQGPEAVNGLNQLLVAQPYNADAWFLKLAIERQGAKKEDFEESRRVARVGLLNRLAVVRQKAGKKEATTRPMDTKEAWDIPDLTAEIQAMNAETPAEVKSDYISTMADLAWLELYFLEAPAEARKVLGPLATLAGDQSKTVARLEGWAYLLENKNDEAKLKLSAVAESDPLAALGLLRMSKADAAQKAQVVQGAEKLLSDNPRGVLAALIWGEMKDLDIRLLPRAGADAYLAEVRKLPREWMNILTSPQSFYNVRCDSLLNGRGYGWPVMARVTIQNLSDLDITISPAGTIRPDLWLDVRFAGASGQMFAELPNQTLAGVAFERMSGQLVLRPRSSVTRELRLDQGMLAQSLTQRPTASFLMYPVMQTNPLFVGNGITPGPAGQRVQGTRTLERGGTPLNSDPQRRRFYQAVTQAEAEERLRSIDMLEAFHVMISREPANSPNRPLIAEVAGSLQNVPEDPAVNVQAWGRRALAMMAPAADVAKIVNKMAESEAWQQRLLALVTAQFRSPELAKTLAKQLSEDADPTVKRYAVATEAAIRLATTRPATGPATVSAPTPVPATVPTVAPRVPPAPTPATEPATVPATMP